MNSNLVVAGIGSLLAILAILPGDAVRQLSSEVAPVAQAVERGNLTISTVPGNSWVMVRNYVYTPRFPPVLDLSGWNDLPVRIVVRDSLNTCIGRITNESGRLEFIFVEADPSMCNGSTPGARGEVVAGGGS
jgi:hypothetical protein